MFHKSKRKTPPTQAELRQRVRRRMTLRGVLAFFVVLTMIRAAFMHRFENIFVCVLALILLALPSIIEKQLAIDIPPLMEGIIYCFIYAAEILGEINSFYTIIPGWDTMLHTLNGFLAAAVGLSMVILLNDNEKVVFDLSPFFLALLAFCFSMTIGVLWEFFEFFMDSFFGMDMQKDTVVHAIHSVTLDPTRTNQVVTISGITDTAVNGESLGLGGYLDIGIIDTMKDLFVNFLGALVFSVSGYFYARSRGKKKSPALNFVPTRKTPEQDYLQQAQEEEQP